MPALAVGAVLTASVALPSTAIARQAGPHYVAVFPASRIANHEVLHPLGWFKHHKECRRLRCVIHANRLWGHRQAVRLRAIRRKHEAEEAREGWAIPWAIVKCESGGANLPPNYAGAAGYYQITDWNGKGGSGAPNANEHSKAEQGAMARKLVAESGYSPWAPSSSCSGY